MAPSLKKLKYVACHAPKSAAENAKKRDRDREDVTNFFQVPRRAIRAMQGQQRVFEYREGIDLADPEMDGEGCSWNQPAAISCGGSRKPGPYLNLRRWINLTSCKKNMAK